MLKSTQLHNVLLLLLITTSRHVFCEESEAFQSLDDESGVCENQCLTISSSKMDMKSNVNSCKRGCRLFGICEWVSTNLTEAQTDCKSACLESYEGESHASQAACVEGCNIALPLAKERHSKLAAEASNIHAQFSPGLLGFHNGLKNPFQNPFFRDGDDTMFGSLDNMMQGMMESAARHFFTLHSFMSSAYSTQIIELSDGMSHNVIVVEVVKPEINTPHPREKKVMLNTDSIGFKTTLKDFVESNLQTNANRRPSLFEFDFTLDYSDEAWGPSNGGFEERNKETKNWWNCFTRKAGLPELVLLLFWISVSMILVMMCIFQFGPRAEKLSINGDLAFITDNKGELPSYMQAYPVPENGKKSPYFLASVVQASEEKVPL